MVSFGLMMDNKTGACQHIPFLARVISNQTTAEAVWDGKRACKTRCQHVGSHSGPTQHL